MSFEKLKATYAASTQGEWDKKVFADILAIQPGYDTEGQAENDAEFIALTHNLMPALIEAVEALVRIAEGSSASGRWLNKLGNECSEEDEGATWEEYTKEEQDDWLEAITRMAHEALAKLNDESPTC
jgi:hypothetical protein